MERRSALKLVLGGAAGLALPLSRVGAQTRPITLFVGFAPGGAVDWVARLIADRVQAILQQPVVVDTRNGGGGQLAMAALRQAPADGRFFVMTPPPVFTVYPTLYPKLPYDAQGDFVPVASACTYAHTLTVGPATPAKTLAEFVAWCKSHPGQANIGVPNLGSAPHFLVWLLARDAGIALEPIGYRGGGPQMIQDVLSGQVAGTISVLSNVVEQHRAGRLRVLATSGPARAALLPEVPTFAERGYKASTIEEWFAFFARAGSPDGDVRRFGDAVRQVLQARDVRAALFAQGYDATSRSPEQLTREIHEETARWADVIARSGFKL